MPNKSIEDGSINSNNKRVSSKPTKWARLDVETKPSSSNSAGGGGGYSSRRDERPRGGGDRERRRDDRDYYRGDDRSIRRTGSSRSSNAPTSTRGNASRSVASNNGSVKSSSSRGGAPSVGGGSRGRGGESTNTGTNATPYITRSNRPSYTESKTPGLNGNPMKPDMSGGQAPYDAKKPKPLLGQPIIIEATTQIPVMANVWTNGATYYFNGPAPFTIDAIGNIKESIKKQM